MAEKLMEKSCIEFADALAAKISVPGGGGAAAYVGALGVALGNMTANFTTGKKKYAEFEEDIQRIIAEGDVIRAKLIDLRHSSRSRRLTAFPRKTPSAMRSSRRPQSTRWQLRLR